MLRRLLTTAAALSAGLMLPTGVTRAADLDAAIPKESESVIVINVRQIIDSELIKKYALGQVKQMMAGNEELQESLKKLGLDPLKDIDKVTIGSWGKTKEDGDGVAIIKGKFQPAKLLEAAEAESKKDGEKLQIVTEGDLKLVKVTVDNLPKPVYATAANDSTLVAGTDKKLVVSTFKAVNEKLKPELKKELAQLLLKQDDKASLYVVGLVDGSTINLPPNANIPGVDSEKLAKQLEKLKSVTMSLNLTDDVGLEINMGLADTNSAEDFGETVSGLIGTVKSFLPLVTGQQPNFKPIADELNTSLKSKTDSKDVVVTLKLTADAISKAAGQND